MYSVTNFIHWMADLDAEYVNVQYSANLTLLNENC